MKGNFLIGFVVCSLLAGAPALAGDSLLRSPEPGLCAAAMAGPDYVPGSDVEGRPVPRADIGARPVPVPDQLLVPLKQAGAQSGANRGRAGGNPAYAAIDGRTVDRLVNPPSPCAAPPPGARAKR